jgi:LmbE family N-acetylglucosaminyl deacetylase
MNAIQPFGLSVPAAEIGSLLGIWAHPDDEAYASAALMSVVRTAGNPVAVVTATRGEHGTPDPDRWPPARLAAIREREIAASLAALDVREHHWLGYEDGALPGVPAKEAVRRLTEHIDTFRPDTIVTFGPDGLTGHRDHQTVSTWVTAAWNRLGRPGRLCYATFTPGFHDRWSSLNDSVGLWMPGAEPPCDPVQDLAFAVECDDDLLDRKLVALRAHASQSADLVAAVGAERYRRWWGTEAFVSAAREAATDLRPAA